MNSKIEKNGQAPQGIMESCPAVIYGTLNLLTNKSVRLSKYGPTADYPINIAIIYIQNYHVRFLTSLIVHIFNCVYFYS